MEHAKGWSREDLEAPQALDSSPGSMLHPVPLQYGAQNSYYNHSPMPNSGEKGYQHWQDSSALPATEPPSAVTIIDEAEREPSSDARIIRLKRATFVLSVSNILLAIGLVVLGVVQSRALSRSGDSGGPSTGSEPQASCPSPR